MNICMRANTNHPSRAIMHLGGFPNLDNKLVVSKWWHVCTCLH